MGRKIEIDIDDLFEILDMLKDCGSIPDIHKNGGHSMPIMIFNIIGDCNLNDIDKYAKMVTERDGDNPFDSYDTRKYALEEVFEAWLGKKAIAEMKDKKEKGWNV